MTKNASAAVSSPPRQQEPGGSQPVIPQRVRLYRLGVWTALHPVKVIAAWLILLSFAAVSAGYFTSHLTGNNSVVTGSESQKALLLMDQEFPGAPSETDFVVLHSATTASTDPAFRGLVSLAVTRFRDSTSVADTASPYDAPERLISADRHTALVPVSLDGSAKELQAAAKPLQDLAAGMSTDRISVAFTGTAPLAAAGVDQGAADLARAESIGLPAAAVVLIIAFGSLVAASIPLLLGVLAVVAAFGALGIVSLFTPFDVFVQTAVSMLAIALGIDYSLFIVTRFREELALMEAETRYDRALAVGRTLASAGHAVLFSGTTVVVSLAGLWLVRSPKVHSMAMGMTAAVLVMMLISVTLLPAMLGILGSRINRLALPWARNSLTRPDPEHSVWARLASMVMRRPVAIATVCTLLLGALAIPAFGLRYGVDLGAGAVADSPAGRGYAVVSDSFAPGALVPINVVASSGDGPLTDSELESISVFTKKAAVNGDVTEVVSITTILDEKFGGHTAKHLRIAVQKSAGASTP